MTVLLDTADAAVPLVLTGPPGVSVTGPQGPQGNAGVAGPQGIQGPRGFKGETGAGLQIKGSVAAPSDLPLFGVSGDTYTVSTSGSGFAAGDGYSWTGTGTDSGTGGNWRNAGALRGPKGDVGAKGDTGNTGPQGNIGPQGNPGPAGQQGPQGPLPDTSDFARLSSGASFGGTVAAPIVSISKSADAFLLLESTTPANTRYRRKIIYSTPNDGSGGDAFLLRQQRPSDGAVLDYTLGGPSGVILTSGNHKIVTAQMLGFRMDGSDQTAAWQGMSSHPLVTEGVTILFPVGDIVLTAGASFTNKSIRFVGAGPGTRIFFRTNNQTCLYVYQGDALYTFEIEGFNFLTSGTGNNAVYVNKPDLPGNIYHGPQIFRNIFRGENPQLGGWMNAVVLVNAGLFKVNFNHCTAGNNRAGTFLTLSGSSTDGTVFDNRCSLVDNFVYVGNGSFAEGLQIGFNKVVGVNIGVFLGAGNNAPGAQILSNHINANLYGIRASQRPQLHILGNLIYKFSAGNFTGILIENGCPATIVQSNQFSAFRDTLTGNAAGIVFNNTNDFLCLDNVFDRCSVGIDGNANSRGVDDRNYTMNCATPRQNFASGHTSGSIYVH